MKIDWKLITDRPVHKVLKSGCRAEEAELRTTKRLANLIAVYSIMLLARLLDDDAQSLKPGRTAGPCADRR